MCGHRIASHRTTVGAPCRPTRMDRPAAAVTAAVALRWNGFAEDSAHSDEQTRNAFTAAAVTGGVESQAGSARSTTSSHCSQTCRVRRPSRSPRGRLRSLPSGDRTARRAVRVLHPQQQGAVSLTHSLERACSSSTQHSLIVAVHTEATARCAARTATQSTLWHSLPE